MPDLKAKEKNRTKYLFNLLEKQDDNKEVIIAAGAYAEEKRISEIINEESSLKRLKPKFLSIGLKEGFTYESKKEDKYFNLLIPEKKRINNCNCKRNPGQRKKSSPS